MYEYPFGNGQQLNLDWFLAEWKNLLAAWDAEKNGIEGALQAEIDRAEAALADVFAARDAAAQSASDADASKSAAAQSASDASGYLATVREDANAARDAAGAAAQSETNAGNSASAAAQSETAAAASAKAAAASAEAAATVLESIPPEYSTLSNYVQGATPLTQYLLTGTATGTTSGRKVTLSKNKAHIKRTATGTGYIGVSLFGNGAISGGSFPSYSALQSANAFINPLNVPPDFALAVDIALFHNQGSEFAIRGISVIQDNNGTPITTAIKNAFPNAGVTGPIFLTGIIPNSILTENMPWTIVFGTTFGNNIGDEADVYVNLRPVLIGASGLMSIRDNISLSDIEIPKTSIVDSE